MPQIQKSITPKQARLNQLRKIKHLTSIHKPGTLVRIVPNGKPIVVPV